jgi:ribA/ribD-fused uncharacterized protein
MDEITSFTGEHRFLSSFWPSEVRASDGIVYPTREHAFQAHKTLDLDERIRIAHLKRPSEAKRAGRALELRPHWESIKIGIMWELIILQFKSGSSMARALMRTHPAYLMEGNTWGDTFWGVCNGQGQNHLGKLLMARREDLLELARE